MAKWAEVSGELEDTLRLKTKPVAYKKLRKADKLSYMENVYRPDRTFT